MSPILPPMSGGRSEWAGVAREAAETVDRSRAVGSQLGLFGDPEAGAADDVAQGDGPRGPGRPKGARNAAKLGLAAYMAAQGWKAPGHAVALAAGLAEDGDGFEVAFRRACWLRASAIDAVAAEDDVQAVARVAGDVMGLTLAIWREQNAAAAQLLPYTLARLAPQDAPKPGAQRPSIGIAAPGGKAPSPELARLLAPADVRAKVVADQGLGEAAATRSDGAASDGAPSA